MKVNGRTITKKDADYNRYVEYCNFCCDKLVDAGYSPNGYDLQTENVAIVKHRNPEKPWDSEGREIYYYDSYIDAAESLLGITIDDFLKNNKEGAL